MKPRLLTTIFLFVTLFLHAQQNPALVDSLKAKLAKTKNPEERITQLGNLAMILLNTSISEADQYGDLAIREAEISRQRPLMVKALLSNGQRNGMMAGNDKSYVGKSLEFYNKALAMARDNKLEKQTVEAMLGLAEVHAKIPELDKAFSYNTQAFAIASAINDDTLKVDNYNLFGQIYQQKKERLLALRAYLNALRIAEVVKNHRYLRSCYANLASFYSDSKEYDKAIDYTQKSTEELMLTNSGSKYYNRVIDLYTLGALYVQKKDFKMSLYYFEKSIQVADSLKYEPLKMNGYSGLMAQYMEADQPQKALEFFNNRKDFKDFITNFGMGYVIDYAYGTIYNKLGRFDSAMLFFKKAEPFFAANVGPDRRIAFYSDYGDLYKRSGNNASAIAYYTRAKLLADTISNLELQQNAVKQLDSLYAKTGNYQQARLYGNLYHTYKDSLQKLGEQKDLMQAELADEQQRQERITNEQKAALEQKHTLQYYSIAIGIGIVFILLVAMGLFRVSEATIKVMGFFSFILLFEFITLLADTKIHHWTHGEPFPILAIKIVLIAALLPLHHWLEHKVVSYLASRRLIVPSGRTLMQRIRNRKSSHHSPGHHLTPNPSPAELGEGGRSFKV